MTVTISAQPRTITTPSRVIRKYPAYQIVTAVAAVTVWFFVWFAVCDVDAWVWTLIPVVLDLTLAALLLHASFHGTVDLTEVYWQVAFAGVVVALFPLLTIVMLSIQVIAAS